MKNGFILSFDVFAAISIAVVMIVAIIEIVSFETGYINIKNLKIGEDVLFILDETGVLNTMDNNTIYEELSKFLPENGCELKLLMYDKNLRFHKELKIIKLKNGTLSQDYETAQRSFIVRDKYGVEYYGVAIIKVW